MFATSHRRHENPKNERSELYRGLTRLFSGPIVNRRSQGVRRYKRHQLDSLASQFRSTSGLKFRKQTQSYLEKITLQAISNQNRAERYAEFDQMEFDPIIASCLNVYAEEMTTSTDLNPLLTIKCQNEEIRAVLRTLYDEILNVEYNLPMWARSVCKYGDFILYLDVEENFGIHNVIALPTHEIEYLFGEDPSNPNYVQYQWNSAGMTFENWQVAHFRVMANDKYYPYGSSVLDPARRIFRQLQLMIDTVMAYRIVRSSERRVFFIDVTGIPPDDVEQFLEQVVTSMKRHEIVDEKSGRIDLRYNPMAIEHDYYIPVRGDQTKTNIKQLPGGAYTGDIDDIKFLTNLLFAALNVPQSYIMRGEGGDEDKMTLASKDVRFARTVQRLQKSIVGELRKMGVIHLYALGYRDEELLSFDLSLANPSRIAELQELEHWKARADVAGAMEAFVSYPWLMRHIFQMSEEEIVRIRREKVTDQKFAAILEAMAGEIAAASEAASAAEFGGLGVDDEELLTPEEELPELGPPDVDKGDSMLLATPGIEEPAAKRKVDKRGMGARTRHLGRFASPEVGTRRKNFPGLNDLISYGRGISEVHVPTYRRESQSIMRDIIRGMDTVFGEASDEDETQ